MLYRHNAHDLTFFDNIHTPKSFMLSKSVETTGCSAALRQAFDSFAKFRQPGPQISVQKFSSRNPVPDLTAEEVPASPLFGTGGVLLISIGGDVFLCTVVLFATVRFSVNV